MIRATRQTLAAMKSSSMRMISFMRLYDNCTMTLGMVDFLVLWVF